MKHSKVIDRLKKWRDRQATLVVILYLSCKDPRVPRTAKIIALSVVAYALSPIDLIPDFIPVLGYLDDLVIIPAGIYIALRLIPREVIEENRERAEHIRKNDLPRFRAAAAVIIIIWILLILAVVYYLYYHA
ncbi:MAG: hypothetical protein CVV44_10215 [Spirochaetae bacterium HGW-Spirochaetae-1]|jgi:uncharacterized membrane protein YkvA (DUF1232 family)|nr:MAG: hypothetical protein CVV44_10215 [Spirochaetae bacterium HGW-Spirochaetae-1]